MFFYDVFEEIWFWIIVIGIILLVIALILWLINTTIDWWFWILIGLGILLIVIGMIWGIWEHHRDEKEEFQTLLPPVISTTVTTVESRSIPLPPPPVATVNFPPATFPINATFNIPSSNFKISPISPPTVIQREQPIVVLPPQLPPQLPQVQPPPQLSTITVSRPSILPPSALVM